MKEITFDDLKQLVCEAKNTSKLIEKIGYAILNKVDEDNFPREMRFKAFEMRNIDDISNAATLYCITQEGFDRSDFNKFAKEFKSAAKELENSGKFKNLDKPIKFTLLAISRDGAWAGCNTTKFMFGENITEERITEDKRPVEKFYIVAERDNPQLGLYLMNVYVGKKRINKYSLSCTFDYYGSPKTLKFTLGVGRDNKHSCISGDNSIYGSVYYYGFDTIENARKYLESEWADSKKLPEILAKLNKDNLTTEANEYDDNCYAVNVRDFHTGLHNLYTGTEDKMEKADTILNKINQLLHCKTQSDTIQENLEILYDQLNDLKCNIIEEIDFRRIDKNNDYYDIWSEKTYHIINNVSYDIF